MHSKKASGDSPARWPFVRSRCRAKRALRKSRDLFLSKLTDRAAEPRLGFRPASMLSRDFNESCNSHGVCPFLRPPLGAAREFQESRKEGEIQKEMGRRGVALHLPC